MLNIYDHYREHGWGDHEPIGEELARPRARTASREDGTAGGTPWRITYRVAGRAPRDRTTTCAPTGRRTCGSPRSASPAARAAAARSCTSARDGASCGEYEAAGPVVPALDPRARRGRRSARSCSSTRASSSRTSSRCAARARPPVYVMHNLHVLPAAPLGLRGQPASTSACCGRIDGHGRDGHAHRAPARRHRRAARADEQHVRRPQPGRRCRRPPEPGPPRDPHRVTIVARLEPQKRLQRRDRRVRARRRTRSRRRGWTSSATAAGATELAGGDRAPAARRHTSRCAASTRGPRRAVDLERVPDDERVRGLPAVDAREHEPRLPRRQLRHQVRPARADHRRRRRLPRSARATSTRSPQRVVELLRSPELVRADERGRARARPRATGRTRSWTHWAGVLQATVEPQAAAHEARGAWTSSSTGCELVSANPLRGSCSADRDFALGRRRTQAGGRAGRPLKVDARGRLAGSALDGEVALELRARVDAESGDGRPRLPLVGHARLRTELVCACALTGRRRGARLRDAPA